jgi:gamma-glutamylcyclotransferase (GGCT)/AIG2-like uncharacterized protein YtfP
MHYFAYGSNLNETDLRDWCARHDPPLPYPLGETIGRAWLPDHQLVFDNRSDSRECGVANVVPRRGFAVPGVVFDVDEAGRKTLSRKEDAPGFYREGDVIALLEDPSGATDPDACMTYLAPPTGEFEKADHRYESVVRAGYAAHGLPLAFLENALWGMGEPLRLFVYGTLMRDRHRHEGLAEFDFVCEATVPGRLLRSPHGYPCLVHGDPGEIVHGELYKIDPNVDIGGVFKDIDITEGFLGFDKESFFQRRTIAAREASGGVIHCWAYHWPWAKDLPVVEGGRWMDA